MTVSSCTHSLFIHKLNGYPYPSSEYRDHTLHVQSELPVKLDFSTGRGPKGGSGRSRGGADGGAAGRPGLKLGRPWAFPSVTWKVEGAARCDCIVIQSFVD